MGGDVLSCLLICTRTFLEGMFPERTFWEATSIEGTFWERMFTEMYVLGGDVS